MNEKVTLQDIVDLLVYKQNITKKDAEIFVKAMFDLIEEVLEREKCVKIKGLGVFKLIRVENRESINVNTGERFEIQGHSKISFTPDPSVRDLINKPFAHFEAVPLNDGTVLEDTIESTTDALDDADDDVEKPMESGDLREMPIMESVEETPVAAEKLELVEETPVIIEEEISSADEMEDHLPQEETEVTENVKISSEEKDLQVPTEEVNKPIDEGKLAFTEEIATPIVNEPCVESKVDIDKEVINPTEEPIVKEEKGNTKKHILWYLLIFFLLVVIGILVYNFANINSSKESIEEVPSIQVQPIPVKSPIKEITTEKDSCVLDSVPEKTLVPVEEKKPQVQSIQEATPMNQLSAQDTYEIVGTMQNHAIQSGETLRKISLKYYGTKELYNYIVKYNPDVIKDPNNVPIGTVIKIPSLKKKE